MRLASSFRLFSLLLLTCLLSEARGFDRPVIEMGKRRAPPPGTLVVFSRSAGLAASGRIVPPMKVPVEVRVEHHFEDGKTLQELKVTVWPDSDGQFLVDFEPPRGGWLPGQKKTTVSIRNLRHVSDGEEWTAVGLPAKSEDFPDAIVPLSKGDVEIDLDQDGDLPALRCETVYLAKGSFAHDSKVVGAPGPVAWLELRKPNEKDLSGTICESWMTMPFARDEKVCDFEIEVPVKKHIEPGVYLLRMNTMGLEGGIKYTVRTIQILPREVEQDSETR